MKELRRIIMRYALLWGLIKPKSSSTVSNQSNTKEFIKKARKIHGNTYDYSKTVYTFNKEKVIMTCRIHGDITMTPNHHLRGGKCAKCNGRYQITPEDFLREAKEIHGNRYDYSKVEYQSKQKKVAIICEKHGLFMQLPVLHLKGRGCSKCANEGNRGKVRVKLTTQEFIDRSRVKHGDRYDYSKTKYISSNQDVVITCREHGDFTQSARSHLYGNNGCEVCKGWRSRKK